MHYQISRNGQTYGPYTLEDLQRYVASGNVLLTDLAKSEEMADWIPVSQLLTPPAPAPEDMPPPGPATPAFSTPSYADPGYSSPTPAPIYGQPALQQAGLAGSPYQDAPNLHWGLVLLFGFLTCGLFMIIWNLVITAWLKRVQPNANALLFYLGVVILFFINIIVGGAASMHMAMHRTDNPSLAALGPMLGVRFLLWFVIWVVRLIARYSERASLQEHFNTVEPIGLNLDPIMTFFFGGVYFQSELNRINAMKQAARFGAGRTF